MRYLYYKIPNFKPAYWYVQVYFQLPDSLRSHSAPLQIRFRDIDYPLCLHFVVSQFTDLHHHSRQLRELIAEISPKMSSELCLQGSLPCCRW